MFIDLAFPNNDGAPATNCKIVQSQLVICLVLQYFVFPKLEVCTRRFALIATFVSMPKTTMNKDHYFIFGKDNVRFTREVLSMKPEPKTKRMKQRADFLLRASVLALDLAHYFAAFIFGEDVHKDLQRIRFSPRLDSPQTTFQGLPYPRTRNPATGLSRPLPGGLPRITPPPAPGAHLRACMWSPRLTSSRCSAGPRILQSILDNFHLLA